MSDNPNHVANMTEPSPESVEDIAEGGVSAPFGIVCFDGGAPLGSNGRFGVFRFRVMDRVDGGQRPSL